MIAIKYLNIIFLTYLIIFYYVLELYTIDVNSDFYFSEVLSHFQIQYILFFSIILNVILHIINKEIIILPFNLLWGNLGIKLLISGKDNIKTTCLIFKYIRNEEEKLKKLNILETNYSYKLNEVQKKEVINNSLNYDDLTTSFLDSYNNYMEINNSTSSTIKQQIVNLVSYCTSNIGMTLFVAAAGAVFFGGIYMFFNRNSSNVTDIVLKQNEILKENNKNNSEILNIIQKENEVIVSNYNEVLEKTLKIQKLNEEQISEVANLANGNSNTLNSIVNTIRDLSEKSEIFDNDIQDLYRIAEGINSLLRETINDFSNSENSNSSDNGNNNKHIPFFGKGRSLKDDN